MTRTVSVRSPLFPPDGLLKLVLNLGPGHPEILKLSLGHRSELAPDPGALSPDTQEVHQRPPEPREHPGL